MLDFSNPELTDFQRDTMYWILGYVVGICILWKLPLLNYLLFPFKIMTVALHEFGHALMALLTGAKVQRIELDLELGGVTHWTGGWKLWVLPAGYLGSSLLGGLMVMSGFDVTASKVASITFGVIMILVLFWARNWVARLTTVAFIALIVGLWFIEEGAGIRHVMLFLGVMSCLYSIWDIIEDLVLRKVNESDASQFAKACFCCPAQVWGLIWALISIVCLGGGIVAGLVIF